PSLLKMCLMCFSTAPWVIHRALAIPAFDCPSAMSPTTSRSPGREHVEGVGPSCAAKEFDHELGVQDGAALADPGERADEFIEVGNRVLEQVADAAGGGREQLDGVVDLGMG